MKPKIVFDTEIGYAELTIEEARELYGVLKGLFDPPTPPPFWSPTPTYEPLRWDCKKPHDSSAGAPSVDPTTYTSSALKSDFCNND